MRWTGRDARTSIFILGGATPVACAAALRMTVFDWAGRSAATWRSTRLFGPVVEDPARLEQLVEPLFGPQQLEVG